MVTGKQLPVGPKLATTNKQSVVFKPFSHSSGNVFVLLIEKSTYNKLVISTNCQQLSSFMTQPNPHQRLAVAFVPLSKLREDPASRKLCSLSSKRSVVTW